MELRLYLDEDSMDQRLDRPLRARGMDGGLDLEAASRSETQFLFQTGHFREIR